jgi:hypothetical protein
MVVLVIVVNTLVGRNDMHTWQVVQKLNGNVYVKNDFGWYWKGLASVTTYPEVIEIYGTKGNTLGSPGDDSANVKFNDGGSADLDWYVRIKMPKPVGDESAEQIDIIVQKQRDFHRMFRSPENVKNAVRSHIRDCVAKTGNLMSASENQASRKAEFYKVAFGQIRDGYYQMRNVTIRRKGLSDLVQAVEAIGDTKPAAPAETTSAGISLAQQAQVVIGEETVEASDTVRAAEIVRDAKGMPIIATPSPLEAYGVEVPQFSIAATEYDPGTLLKFQEKRALLLATETARAESVRSAQERLKNIAEGNKAIAETEAIANQEKARKVISAQILQEVEGVRMKVREVEGQTKVEVAAVMNKQLTSEQATAELEAQTAENERKAAEVLAKAREQMIALGGAVTDSEQTLQEVYTKQIEAVAQSFAGLQVPDTVIIAMDSVPEGQSPLAFALPSLQFLQAAGLTGKLEEDFDTKWVPKTIPPAPIVTPPIASSIVPPVTAAGQ